MSEGSPSSCTLDGRLWSANAAAGFRNPGLGGIETVFTHDPASGGPHAVASRTVGGSTASYSYDAVGNMVGITEGAASTTLTWDARNRLTSWSDGTTTHSFTYDASGERVTSSDGTVTTIFLGDVEVGSDGTDRTLYRFAGSLVAIRTTTGATTTLEFVVTDHLGSPHVTFDPVSQAVSGTRLHRPYGTTRDQTGAIPGTVGYTGQYQDPTGLAYYGARYYDPTLMVFISADTIIPDPSIPADLNRYGYVRGNPVKYVDPTGNDPDESYLCSGCGTPRIRIQFSVPKVKGVGRVELRLPIFHRALFGTQGDNRENSINASIYDARAGISVDFETGRGEITIAASCASSGENECSGPLPTLLLFMLAVGCGGYRGEEEARGLLAASERHAEALIVRVAGPDSLSRWDQSEVEGGSWFCGQCDRVISTMKLSGVNDGVLDDLAAAVVADGGRASRHEFEVRLRVPGLLPMTVIWLGGPVTFSIDTEWFERS